MWPLSGEDRYNKDKIIISCNEINFPYCRKKAKNMKKKSILFVCMLLIVMLITSTTAFATSTVHKEASKSTYVTVEVTNLATGVKTNETMRAGTWYLYATATYGGTNDAYPVSIGANDLYYNETYISAGGYYRGNPTESTSSNTDAQGNKTSITLNYSRPVGVKYAARASKTDASVSPSNYSYGPTDGSSKDFTISFKITCYKK